MPHRASKATREAQKPAFRVKALLQEHLQFSRHACSRRGVQDVFVGPPGLTTSTAEFSDLNDGNLVLAATQRCALRTIKGGHLQNAFSGGYSPASSNWSSDSAADDVPPSSIILRMKHTGLDPSAQQMRAQMLLAHAKLSVGGFSAVPVSPVNAPVNAELERKARGYRPLCWFLLMSILSQCSKVLEVTLLPRSRQKGLHAPSAPAP